MSNRFSIPVIHRVPIYHTNRYSKADLAVKNKCLRWIFNKVFSLMEKKGYLVERPMYEENYSVHTSEIDMDRLDEQIASNRILIESIFNGRIDTLIVGHDVMRQIMRGDPHRVGQVNLMMNQKSRYAMYSGRNDDLSPRYEHVMYQGLNIILVPWFEGFLPIGTERR